MKTLAILAIIAAVLFILVTIYGIHDTRKTDNEIKSLKKRYAKKEKDKWRELS